MKIRQPIALIFLILLLTSCHLAINNNNSNDNNIEASAINTQLGLAYLKQGNRQRAKQKILMALQESPNSLMANDAMAYYFENVQDMQHADYYYQQALQFYPESGAALNNYGAFLCRQKQYDLATSYFLKAAADLHYLNTGLIYENAGLCALSAKHYSEAKKYFKKALEYDPHLVQSKFELETLSHSRSSRYSSYNSLNLGM